MAPTAFKGSASPMQAARQMKRGWLSARPRDRVALAPMADGGDGTIEALRASAGGSLVRRTVRGPLGSRVRASCLRSGSLAVVETASASGLALMRREDLDPMRADTRGTGELILACLAAGAARVMLGLGGSATTDGGAGCAHALGVRFLDSAGRELEPNPLGLGHLARIDRSRMHPHAGVVEGLADVRSPLLGSRGAAAMFAPQKGATGAEVAELDRVLRRLARVSGAREAARDPGAGAAGGLGFGVVALLGGRLAPGGHSVADAIGLFEKMAGSDLVVTGEGRLDEQTLQGKAPMVVARLAREAGVRCAAIVGSNTLAASRARRAGFDVVVDLGARQIGEVASELAAGLWRRGLSG
jgi:glycerate kinase